MASELITLSDPRSPMAEAYRTLRTNLMFSNVDANLRLIALSAPTETEDKSLSLANLAVTLAQGENRTLIVDADLRQPQQHEIWGLENERGLTDMLLDATALRTPPLQKTRIEGLQLLASGALPINPTDALASRKMDAILERLRAEADYILFDVPPVLVASDAAVLGRKLDGLLLVVKAGATRRDPLTRARDQLEQVGVNLIGVVMTNAPRSQHDYRYSKRK